MFCKIFTPDGRDSAIPAVFAMDALQVMVIMMMITMIMIMRIMDAGGLRDDRAPV